jgi:hypothetical protein
MEVAFVPSTFRGSLTSTFPDSTPTYQQETSDGPEAVSFASLRLLFPERNSDSRALYGALSPVLVVSTAKGNPDVKRIIICF